LPPVFWRDSQIIDPASVTLITCHAGGDDLAVKDAHQKPFRVHLEFSFDVSLGIVLRDDHIALQPELKDGCLILSLIRSNHQVIHDSSPLRLFFSVSLIAGCSKRLRYKAPEIPRNETYSPVRRSDEG
jgi:hypothetical protein